MTQNDESDNLKVSWPQGLPKVMRAAPGGRKHGVPGRTYSPCEAHRLESLRPDSKTFAKHGQNWVCSAAASWIVDGYHLCPLHAGRRVLSAVEKLYLLNVTQETPNAEETPSSP